MSRSVDQVEDILLAVVGVVHLDRVALDGDAAFALQVHGVEKLILHLSGHDGTGTLEESIGQGCLAMIDVSDDTKITNPLCFHH